MAAALLATALLAAAPVVLLPVDAADVPAEAVRAASEALLRALPPLHEAAPHDADALRVRLEAAGPACRRDPLCVCSAVPLAAGDVALDVQVDAPGARRTWAVDVRLWEPCEGRLSGRRAEVVAPRAEPLAIAVHAIAAELLRRRAMGPLRWTDAPAADTARPARADPVPPAAPARRAARPAPAEAPAAALFIKRGMRMLADRQPLNALDNFIAANRLSPELAEPRYWMAEAYRAQGRIEEARRWYESYAQSRAADVDEAQREQARQWVAKLGR